MRAVADILEKKEKTNLSKDQFILHKIEEKMCGDFVCHTYLSAIVTYHV